MVTQKHQYSGLSRRVATEGMVLLKNTGAVLPLRKGSKIALFGKGQIDFIKGGDGSAEVYSEYTKNLLDGMLEKKDERKVILYHPLVDLYLENRELVLTDDIIESVSQDVEIAIITISRTSSEGTDRNSEKGDFYLSGEEADMLDRINNSSIESIIVVLNVGSVIDTKWISKYPKIKAVLLAWQPGMEGGRAAADILCGDANPSGKLTDTFATSYEAYPSAQTFKQDAEQVSYEEDVFVGYRYFETIPDAYEKVVFPFGYGLSYTTFEMADMCLEVEKETAKVKVRVANTGNTAGKEVVQVYFNAPEGLMDKPKIQLIAYAKTKLLAPGEYQELVISFSITEMASFDDTGATGIPFAYVMEKGGYNIFVGNSSRNLELAGTYNLEETTVVRRMQSRWEPMLTRRLRKDGSFIDCGIPKTSTVKNENVHQEPRCGSAEYSQTLMLSDVAAGHVTLDEFVSQMTDEELVNLAQAQPPAFPRGTAGIGNQKKYGIPNPQTADGPAGLRKSVPTTAFPCATLIGCTWDEELQYEVGNAIGCEGIATDVDIWLAPGINIHRDPLCGRNFEYFSEDPLISGKSGAAIIRGAQSAGIVATCKHFAANNKEHNRYYSNSIVSERALREIYLKGFELVVKESQPGCIMSSYNLINGIRNSTNYNLLTGILRDEWGYKGVVMTDWRNPSHLWEEIKAGNNIKMPFGYPDEIELALEMVRCGRLTRRELEVNVKPILSLIIKTNRFTNQDFGISHTILQDGTTRIKAIEFTGTSYTLTGSEPCSDQGEGRNLTCLNKDQRGNDTYLIYQVTVQKAGDYLLTARVATVYDEPFLEFYIDDKILTAVYQEQPQITPDKGALQHWKTLGPVRVTIPQGEHILKIYIRTFDDKQSISFNWFQFEPKTVIGSLR